VTHTRLQQQRRNMHTNGAHGNNKDNTTPLFIGLRKATQETRTSHEDSARKDKE
jgi:hypothetical protein